jgi:phosphoglycolate phosphatase
MPITRRTYLTQSSLGLVAAGLEVADAAGTSRIRLVVLDVGGTIIQDRGDVPEAMVDACAHHGIHVTPEEVAPFRGASKREVIRRFVEQKAASNADRGGLAEAIYAEFNARVIGVYRNVPPIEGAEDAFRRMRAAGLLLAACTGFGRPVADSIFARLKWQDYFVTVVTGDDITQGRPAPFMIYRSMEAARVVNVAEVIAVGDTPLDIQAANNGGVRGVGVLSGVGTEEKLRAEKPVAILSSVAVLPEWIQGHDRSA